MILHVLPPGHLWTARPPRSRRARSGAPRDTRAPGYAEPARGRSPRNRNQTSAGARVGPGVGAGPGIAGAPTLSGVASRLDAASAGPHLPIEGPGPGILTRHPVFRATATRPSCEPRVRAQHVPVFTAPPGKRDLKLSKSNAGPVRKQSIQKLYRPWTRRGLHAGARSGGRSGAVGIGADTACALDLQIERERHRTSGSRSSFS